MTGLFGDRPACLKRLKRWMPPRPDERHPREGPVDSRTSVAIWADATAVEPVVEGSSAATSGPAASSCIRIRPRGGLEASSNRRTVTRRRRCTPRVEPAATPSCVPSARPALRILQAMPRPVLSSERLSWRSPLFSVSGPFRTDSARWWPSRTRRSHFGRGEVACLIGPNRVGKSTLVFRSHWDDARHSGTSRFTGQPGHGFRTTPRSRVSSMETP
jgi:hypothetical protein